MWWTSACWRAACRTFRQRGKIPALASGAGHEVTSQSGGICRRISANSRSILKCDSNRFRSWWRTFNELKELAANSRR